MTYKPERRQGPRTEEDAAAFIRALSKDRPEPLDDDEESEENQVAHLLGNVRSLVEKSQWWAVTDHKGGNPLVALLRNPSDSVDVTVISPGGEPFSGTLFQKDASLVRPGSSASVEGPTRTPAPEWDSISANAPELFSLKADSGDDENAEGGGHPMTLYSLSASGQADAEEGFDSLDEEDALAIELTLPDLPATTRVVHIEVTELRDRNQKSSDLISCDAAQRREVIDPSRSAILTTRHTPTGLAISTTREELGELCSESAVFGLVCIQEGGEADV